MNKRDFLNNALLLGLGAMAFGCSSNTFSNNNQTANTKTKMNLKRIKPKGLKIGDKIGVIAPSTNVSDPEDVARAIKTLEYFGFVPVLGEYLQNGSGYKTRLPQERASDLHSMFENDEINGIIAIRGGYGSPQILDKIDFDLIKNNPKVFCGYSDITALNIAIYQNTGLVTFHGPVLMSNFSPYTEKSFRDLIFAGGTNPFQIKYFNPDTKKGILPMYPTLTIKDGEAEGELVGGNLSLISGLMGTPYEIDTKGKLFFLEDVGEKPFRVDRMLTQLRLAGKFDDAAGIIIGKCEDCGPEGSGATTWDRTVNEVYYDILSDLNKPIVANMMIGHSTDRLTLPLGIKAKLNSTEASLTILESAVE
jgi:muramoyltetrapeptide carboxypeptidase